MITTDNITELIKEYLNVKEDITIIQVTKQNGDDYQIWDNSCSRELIPNLPFDNTDLLMFHVNREFDSLHIIQLIQTYRNKKLSQLGI